MLSSARRLALVAGLAYFLTHVTSVAAAAIVAPLLTDPGLAAAQEWRVPTVVLLEFLLGLGCVVTGVALLPLLRPRVPALGYAFAALRIVEAAVIGVGSVALLALAWVAARSGVGAEPGELLMGLHQGSFLVGQGLVISVNTIVIGLALRHAQIVPRAIGTLGVIGGVIVLLGNLLQLFGVMERAGGLAMLSAVAVFAFEIWFAGYLVVRGVRSAPTAVPAT